MRRPTRLRLGILLLAALSAAGCGGSAAKQAAEPPVQHFSSRPDLEPPVVTVSTPAHGTTPGYVFFAPKKKVVQAGPMIVDDEGHLVWFKPLDTHGVTDFRAQRYHGKPVLTWWRGQAVKGVGDGYYVMLDSSYRHIADVRAGHGLAGDVHEFLITPRNTALITVYRRVDRDLSSVGGPKQGSVYEGVVQELDIASGRVLFEWHSLPAVGLGESYEKPPPAEKSSAATPYDYFHLNSIDVDTDGDLLVSARNTRAVYKIRRRDGKILWRLGGKKSDFVLGRGATFAFQHDVRRQPDGTITVFDNGAGPPAVEKRTRVLVLRVDERRRKAALVRSYTHPAGLLSFSQGDGQFLPNGHVFVGWGANPYFTEFDRRGRVLFDAHFDRGSDSYRAYRLAWTGHPTDRPAVAVSAGKDGRTTVFASWNGATEVARWRVLAGDDPRRLRGVASADRSGFETAISVRVPARYLAVQALSGSGAVLGASKPVTRKK